jgi:hypothetical protein
MYFIKPSAVTLESICNRSGRADAIITGWWYTYPSEKYESQLGSLFPTEWKNKLPNRQPDQKWADFRFAGGAQLR